MNLAEYQSAENPEPIYDHEVDGDPIFERIIDDLMEQATKYIAGAVRRE